MTQSFCSPLTDVKTQVQLALYICKWSASMDSTKLRLKIFGKKKIPQSSKKQNLNLRPANNYLYSIYIVLGIISNLEMI